MEDATTRYIRAYKRFAKQCISEGIQKEHIPLLWHSYKIGRIGGALFEIDSSLCTIVSYLDGLNQSLFSVEQAIYNH